MVSGKKIVTSDSTQYCKIERTELGVLKVVMSVVIQMDTTWSIFIFDKEVPNTCRIFDDFPDHLPLQRQIELVETVHKAAVCPGNPEDRFVSLCKRRGGEVRGERGRGSAVAYIDNNVVIDSQGTKYCCSVRRTDCDLLCGRNSGFPVRCKSCNNFRCALRSTVSRDQRQDGKDHTLSDSCTNYIYITSAEKDSRLKNMHTSLVSARQRNSALEAKIASLIKSHSLPLQDADADDINSIISDVTPVVEEKFPLNTPQRILWDQQVQYNHLKDKRQMRWHPYVIRFALNLKYLSNSAYKAARLSGAIKLPSERTLADYTHWATPHSGVQLEFVEEFLRLLEDVTCGHHLCALLMDEMKIKSGLVFNKHSGALVGFTDLGSVNRDIELLMGCDGEEEMRSKLADQVFVFMARAVFKPSLTVPIAHYFSLNLKGIKFHGI